MGRFSANLHLTSTSSMKRVISRQKTRSKHGMLGRTITCAFMPFGWHTHHFWIHTYNSYITNHYLYFLLVTSSLNHYCYIDKFESNPRMTHRRAVQSFVHLWCWSPLWRRSIASDGEFVTWPWADDWPKSNWWQRWWKDSLWLVDWLVLSELTNIQKTINNEGKTNKQSEFFRFLVGETGTFMLSPTTTRVSDCLLNRQWNRNSSHCGVIQRQRGAVIFHRRNRWKLRSSNRSWHVWRIVGGNHGPPVCCSWNQAWTTRNTLVWRKSIFRPPISMVQWIQFRS